MKKTYTGLNIQFPISELITSKKKSIETRTYPIPDKYKNVPMLMVETPGPKGNFKSRIVAVIVFEDSFKYDNANAFYADKSKHHVTPDSDWAWQDSRPKWGWKIKSVKKVKPREVRKRLGIKYTLNLSLK